MQGAPLKFMVCNDGSDQSISALEATAHGYMREGDHLMIAHIWSAEKEEYLTYNLKRDHIKQRNTADFAYLGGNFFYQDTEMNEGETAKEHLNQMALECEVDVTVVGFHGRKGPKADPTVMGSAV